MISGYNHPGIKPKEAIMAHVISSDCVACGSCIAECPTEAISEGDIYVIDAEKMH